MSGAVGLSVGLGVSAWHGLGTGPEPILVVRDTSVVSPPLQPFFPDLGAVESQVQQAGERAILRREAQRQRQLNQTREVLAFSGATTEDIEAHLLGQFAAETAHNGSIR